MTLKNRSAEFLLLRKNKYIKESERECTEVEKGFEKITKELARISKSISDVETQCKVYCMPSFSSKSEALLKLEGLKYQVARDLSRCKGVMHSFSEKHKATLNPSLIHSVQTHFSQRLDGIISRLNETQAMVAMNAEKVAVFDTIEKASVALSPEMSTDLIPVHNTEIESIHKSIFFLSSLIKELKSVVVSQSDKIERLDFIMETVSSSAGKTFKEINTMSTMGSRTKNRIIFILFSLIILLIMLSLLKAHTIRVRKNNAF